MFFSEASVQGYHLSLGLLENNSIVICVLWKFINITIEKDAFYVFVLLYYLGDILAEHKTFLIINNFVILKLLKKFI